MREKYGPGSIRFNTVQLAVSRRILFDWRVHLFRASMNARHTALCCRGVRIRLFSFAPSGASLAGSRTQGSASLHPWATIRCRFAAQRLSVNSIGARKQLSGHLARGVRSQFLISLRSDFSLDRSSSLAEISSCSS